MNKKLLTIATATVIILALLIAGGFMIRYYSSFKKVSITIERPGVTAEVYELDTSVAESNDIKPIISLNESGNISLAPSKYIIVPRGDNIDESQISFTVEDKDISVMVNPAYSQEYLNAQLEKEFPLIKQVLQSKYGATLAGFVFNRGKLYEDGSWYATTFVKDAQGSDIGDVYRTVLHKADDKWQVAAPPQLVLSSLEYPNIPTVILRDINQPVDQ